MELNQGYSALFLAKSVEVMLSTQRLVLRNFQLSDLESTHIYASNPEVVKFQRWGPNHLLSETQNFLLEAKQAAKMIPRMEYDLAIVLKEENQHIGGCGIYLESDRPKTAHLGYILNPEYWGNGYGTEAARAMIKLAFELGLEKVEATCDTRNLASKRILEKCGMKLVETFQEERLQKGSVRWSHLFYIENIE